MASTVRMPSFPRPSPYHREPAVRRRHSHTQPAPHYPSQALANRLHLYSLTLLPSGLRCVHVQYMQAYTRCQSRRMMSSPPSSLPPLERVDSIPRPGSVDGGGDSPPAVIAVELYSPSSDPPSASLRSLNPLSLPSSPSDSGWVLAHPSQSELDSSMELVDWGEDGEEEEGEEERKSRHSSDQATGDHEVVMDGACSQQVRRTASSGSARPSSIRQVLFPCTPGQLRQVDVHRVLRSQEDSIVGQQENIDPNLPRPRLHRLPSTSKSCHLRVNPTRRTTSRPLTLSTLFTSSSSDSSQQPQVQPQQLDAGAAVQPTVPSAAHQRDVIFSSLAEEGMEAAGREDNEEGDIPPSSDQVLRPVTRTSAQGHALRRQVRLGQPVYPDCSLTVEGAVACLAIAMVSPVQGSPTNPPSSHPFDLHCVSLT